MAHTYDLFSLVRPYKHQRKYMLYSLSAHIWPRGYSSYWTRAFFLTVDVIDWRRINTLLVMEEQRNFSLENLKRRQQTVKKYFNKRAKAVEFKIDDKVLLWDSAHAERGRHSKFQKLWIGPFKIASILGTDSYLLKDMDGRLFS